MRRQGGRSNLWPPMMCISSAWQWQRLLTLLNFHLDDNWNVSKVFFELKLVTESCSSLFTLVDQNQSSTSWLKWISFVICNHVLWKPRVDQGYNPKPWQKVWGRPRTESGIRPICNMQCCHTYTTNLNRGVMFIEHLYSPHQCPLPHHCQNWSPSVHHEYDHKSSL